MKLYCARHGKTDWNGLDRVQGRTDNPLNEEGIEQAKRLGEACCDLSIDLIISIPIFSPSSDTITLSKLSIRLTRMLSVTYFPPSFFSSGTKYVIFALGLL